MKTLLLSAVLMVFFAGMLVAQTPIAHWPLNGDTEEIIGFKNGIQVGGVSWVTDPKVGDCASFDGIDGVINLPAVIWESKTDTNTTITCWFNWAGGGDWQRVYSLGMTDGAWQCMYFCPRDGNTAHSLHVTFKTTVPDQWYDYVNTNFTDFDTVTRNTWYFSAIILKEDSLKIWMNDKVILKLDNVPVTPQKIQPDISQNVLGKSHWADPTFKGMIDDFRIYGAALTDAQVLALYNAVPTGNKEITSDLTINFYGKEGRIWYNSVDENKISEISVYSLSGALLFSSKKLSDIKTQHFEPGIYLVSLTSGKEHITKKVALFK